MRKNKLRKTGVKVLRRKRGKTGRKTSPFLRFTPILRSGFCFGLDEVFTLPAKNAESLLYRLNREKVKIRDFSKTDGKVNLRIKREDVSKFFAITKELCYNKDDIKRLKICGPLYPAYVGLKNFGIVIGALVFIVFCIWFRGVMLGVEFYGSGEAYKRQARKILSDRGIVPFTRFSEIDVKSLESEILSSSQGLSFVGIKKVGNVLRIELVSATVNADTFTGDATSLTAEVGGRIEKLKVLRGEARFSVGDEVKAGDVIVCEDITVNGVPLKVNVIAEATISHTETFTYISEKDGEEDIAELLARGFFGDEEPYKIGITSLLRGQTYIYTAELCFTRKICAG